MTRAAGHRRKTRWVGPILIGSISLLAWSTPSGKGEVGPTSAPVPSGPVLSPNAPAAKSDIIGELGPTSAPAQTEAVLPADAPAAKSDLITNIWVDTELHEVIQDISAQTGTTIIADQSVQGVISMAADQMPLEECLERLCAVGGFSFVKIKDYYVMGRAEPGTALFRMLASLERVKLKHASAEQVRALLPGTLARYVTFDKINSIVLVSAPDSIRQRILDAIQLIDSPNQQIAIEVIVFELTEDGSKHLGLNWQYSHPPNTNVHFENLVGTVTYEVADDIATRLDVTLRAIVQSGKGRVLANPRIVAMNGRPAEIFVGQEKYFSLLSGQASNPYYRLESIKSGVMLTVTPYNGLDGHMVLELAPEVSDVAADWTRASTEATEEAGAASLPVVTRRRASTSVAIKDGQTVVIGGLLRERHRSTVEKIPFLGDLPIVGAAFRRARDLKEQQEVVILITTYLMCDGRNSGPSEVATALERRYLSPLDAIGVRANGDKLCYVDDN